jgi:MFS family permease
MTTSRTHPKITQTTRKGRSRSAWTPVAAAMFCCGWGGNQFTPLLVMYRRAGYSVFTVDALLGAYVIGLVPSLLISGGLSDRYGRKPVMLAGTVLSLVASIMLALGRLGVALLASGRFVTGIAVAVAMAVGSTWVKELSDADPAAATGLGTRRAALWLTLGLGIGPGTAGPWLALGTAIVLGTAYGIAVVSGLLELQRLARPAELAKLTGVYYALAYIGFLLPSLLAALSGVASYPMSLSCLVIIALAGTLVIARHSRKHLPTESAASA